MESNLEEKIRRLKIPQLEILKLLATSESGVSSAKEFASTTHTSSYTLGAMITPIRRIRTANGYLIIPAGREENSFRWQLNEKVMSKQELKKLLAEMDI